MVYAETSADQSQWTPIASTVWAADTDNVTVYIGAGVFSGAETGIATGKFDNVNVSP